MDGVALNPFRLSVLHLLTTGAYNALDLRRSVTTFSKEPSRGETRPWYCFIARTAAGHAPGAVALLRRPLPYPGRALVPRQDLFVRRPARPAGREPLRP